MTISERLAAASAARRLERTTRVMQIRWERDPRGWGWWRVYCPECGCVDGWPPERVSGAHDYARLHARNHTGWRL